MNEMDILERYLKENDYIYEQTIEDNEYLPRDQIVVYNSEGKRVWDAICHKGSYGFDIGLIEIMGSIVPKELTVEGWLTAADIIKRINKHE